MCRSTRDPYNSGSDYTNMKFVVRIVLNINNKSITGCARLSGVVLVIIYLQLHAQAFDYLSSLVGFRE